jgi:hypothetical protein
LCSEARIQGRLGWKDRPWTRLPARGWGGGVGQGRGERGRAGGRRFARVSRGRGEGRKSARGRRVAVQWGGGAGEQVAREPERTLRVELRQHSLRAWTSEKVLLLPIANHSLSTSLMSMWLGGLDASGLGAVCSGLA